MPDLLERQVLRARNGLAYLTGAKRPAVAQTPRDLAWKRDRARLWRYRSELRRYRPPVLIVNSLVSKSYVLDLLPNTSEVTLIGYCFGGILTLLVAAGHPELPIRNMMVMATPCDYPEMGFMSNMFRDGRLDPDDVIDETGLVPARALDEGFQTLKPTEVLVQRVNFFETSGTTSSSGDSWPSANGHVIRC